MKNIKYVLFYLLLGINMAIAQTNSDNVIVMELKYGKVLIELYPEIAPEHVKRIKTLSSEGFYDNIVFHRVIDGFMVQTGDPTGTGSGGSKLPNLKAEFNSIDHVRGVLSMARSANPDSANSQFFIMLADSPHLNHQYTAFGRVIEGMEFVDKIKKGDSRNNGMVQDPDSIIRMRLKQDF
jgi:peptidylprolyl isomerase